MSGTYQHCMNCGTPRRSVVDGWCRECLTAPEPYEAPEFKVRPSTREEMEDFVRQMQEYTA